MKFTNTDGLLRKREVDLKPTAKDQLLQEFRSRLSGSISNIPDSRTCIRTMLEELAPTSAIPQI